MLKICLVAICGTIAVLILRELNKEYALYTAIVCGIVILFFSLDYIIEIVEAIKEFSSGYGISNDIIEPVFKMTASAYIAKFTCDILKEAGMSGISEKVDIFAKLYILVLTLPVIREIMQFITELL